MLYLLLQTTGLLSICAIVFFGIGWLASRWMETKNPWRRPSIGPRRGVDASALESLQANLRQVSDELSQRNLNLQATRQSLQETERKWLEATERVSELEFRLSAQEQGHEQQLGADPNQPIELASVVGTPLSDTSIESSPEQGIAPALREQLKNLEARIENLQSEHATAVQTIEEQERVIYGQQQTIAQFAALSVSSTEVDNSLPVPIEKKPAESILSENVSLEPLWTASETAENSGDGALDAQARASLEQERESLELEKQQLDANKQALWAERQQLEALKQSLEEERDRIDLEKNQAPSEWTMERDQAAAEEEQQALMVKQRQLEADRQALILDRQQLEIQRERWSSEKVEIMSAKAATEAKLVALEKAQAELSAEQEKLLEQSRNQEEARREIAAERQRLSEQQQATALERRQVELHEEASNSERQQWMEKIEAWEKQLAEEPVRDNLDEIRAELLSERRSVEEKAEFLDKALADLEEERRKFAVDRQRLEEERRALAASFEKQRLEQMAPPAPAPAQPQIIVMKEPANENVDEMRERMERLERQEETLEQDFKKRLSGLEDTIRNLRAESEMALLAQLEFQTKASDTESEERRRWEDLEHELEMRITQLERELASVRQAEQLVSQIGEQVEVKLQEQLQSLATEVLEIKSSWTHQEEEFKNRDEHILGNLDRLQETIAKLSVKIEEEDAVPDSMLKEMEALKLDILASVPPAVAAAVEPLRKPLSERRVQPQPPLDSSPVRAEMSNPRGRFERATDTLQAMLEEKERKIRMLDEQMHAMARKLDPTLTGQDDLQLIKGIGPYIKRILEKEFGIYSFKQIAQLKQDEIAKISTRLYFKNKIEKEDWIGQATELHHKKYDEIPE